MAVPILRRDFNANPPALTQHLVPVLDGSFVLTREDPNNERMHAIADGFIKRTEPWTPSDRKYFNSFILSVNSKLLQLKSRFAHVNATMQTAEEVLNLTEFLRRSADSPSNLYNIVDRVSRNIALSDPMIGDNFRKRFIILCRLREDHSLDPQGRARALMEAMDGNAMRFNEFKEAYLESLKILKMDVALLQLQVEKVGLIFNLCVEKFKAPPSQEDKARDRSLLEEMAVPNVARVSPVFNDEDQSVPMDCT